MKILGISAYYHDSAAAIIVDGKIVAAVQEERFSRIKNDSNFPSESIRFCLQKAALKIDDLDAVVYYEKPFLKFERLLETYYAFAPVGITSFIKSMPVWLKGKIFIKSKIKKELRKIQPYDKKKFLLLFTEHHLSHAASAYYPSGFEEAAILTIDAVGEFATTTICKGVDNNIEVIKEMHFPHSVGLLYSAFTYYLGFTVNSDEYKLMGLAPYGNPTAERTKKFVQLIFENIVELFDDGSIRLNQKYFQYATGLRMINEKKFEQLFGFATRKTQDPFLPEHLDCAMAIQQVTEAIILRLVQHVKQITKSDRICLAGGVALNCVANGKIASENFFTDIFIQPAAGDAGAALGAALAAYHIYFKQPLSNTIKADKMNGSYLGPSYANNTIDQLLIKENANKIFFSSTKELCDAVANLLADGKVVGWFQNSMEFGPRALGNRSILADARNPDMQRILNMKIKFREGFRPFAPIVAEEDAANYFQLNNISPYMLFVHQLQPQLLNTLPPNYNSLHWQEKLSAVKSKLPAITHVDFSARIQTVNAESNPFIYELLQSFKAITGYSVLINTSFNVKDEPIVCTPEEAYACFNNTGMDYLVMGNYLVSKK